MGFDAPRSSDRTAEMSDREQLRRQEKNRLLALAGALADIGIRARLVEYYLRPTVLRCWETHQMSPTRLVTCERSTGSGARWEFRFHPSGDLLANAQDVTGPDNAKDAAEALAAAFTAASGACPAGVRPE